MDSASEASSSSAMMAIMATPGPEPSPKLKKAFQLNLAISSYLKDNMQNWDHKGKARPEKLLKFLLKSRKINFP